MPTCRPSVNLACIDLDFVPDYDGAFEFRH